MQADKKSEFYASPSPLNKSPGARNHPKSPSTTSLTSASIHQRFSENMVNDEAAGVVETSLDGVLMTNYPGEKKKLLKGEWRKRYCLLERKAEDEFTILVYKTKSKTPSPEDRGIFRWSLSLTSTTSIVVKNNISKTAPFFWYVVAVDVGNGNLVQFSSSHDDVRNRWNAAFRGCVALISREPFPPPYIDIDGGGGKSGLAKRRPAARRAVDNESCKRDNGDSTVVSECGVISGDQSSNSDMQPGAINDSLSGDDREAGGEEGPRRSPPSLRQSKSSHSPVQNALESKSSVRLARPSSCCLDGKLLTRVPGDKARLMKSDWRNRYCLLKKKSPDEFVVLVYKLCREDPIPDDPGALRQSILLTASTRVWETNEVKRYGPRFRYVCALGLDDGQVYQFSSFCEGVRNAWVSALEQCVDLLRRSQERLCTGSVRRPLKNKEHVFVSATDSKRNGDAVVPVSDRSCSRLPTPPGSTTGTGSEGMGRVGGELCRDQSAPDSSVCGDQPGDDGDSDDEDGVVDISLGPVDSAVTQKAKAAGAVASETRRALDELQAAHAAQLAEKKATIHQLQEDIAELLADRIKTRAALEKAQHEMTKAAQEKLSVPRILNESSLTTLTHTNEDVLQQSLSVERSKEFEKEREARVEAERKLAAMCTAYENTIQELHKQLDTVNMKSQNMLERLRHKIDDLMVRKEAEKEEALRLCRLDMWRALAAASINGAKHAASCWKEGRGNVSVMCRVGLNLANDTMIGDGMESIEITSAHEVVVTQDSSISRYEFDEVFPPAATQYDVFDNVSPLLGSVLDGHNICIFAYGPSGSGKTFTIDGYGADKGIMPRAVGELFARMESHSGSWTYTVAFSMLNINNETISDLLHESGDEYKLDIREGSEVLGMAVHEVRSPEDAMQLTSQGRACQEGSRGNKQSRCSHTLHIFTCRGRSLNSGKSTFGILNFIDLAGSEQLNKTGCTSDSSLDTLADVMRMLSAKVPATPGSHRKSKLTHVLEDSLQESSKVLMIVHLSLASSNVGEAIRSLNFSSRCRNMEKGQAKSTVNISTPEASSLSKSQGKKLRPAGNPSPAVKRKLVF